MSKDKKIEDDYARLQIVKTWRSRSEKLKENKGIKHVSFCRKHGINPTEFSRAKNLAQIPRWEKINQIEKAFEAEGLPSGIPGRSNKKPL